MISILKILFIVFVVWGVVYEVFYSPKARIRRLWKEVLSISFKIGEQKKISPDIHNPLIAEYRSIIERKKKMISALLEYYLDPEKDEEYIHENTP